MPTKKLRTDAQENLVRILDSARVVFAALGLEATLADVAKHAGVGVGTVYRRFPSKDALIGAVVDLRIRDVAAVANEALLLPDPFSGVVHFLEGTAQMMSTDRALREIVIEGRTSSSHASERFPEETLAEIALMKTEVLLRTTELIDRAKASGDLRDDVTASDLAVLSFAVQSAGDLGSIESPYLWRRVLGLLVDGLKTSRAHPSPLPVKALTDDELQRAFAQQRM